ncbi:RNA 2',3'-cyclic phosphodiesterase [Xiamenia xianingshaonis]|uniref:RNA 2',3'-cyclic phosphodiesterase n=1 Tax=Xiamenia xianingshaonis TaxID=2682776 RepID=A0ABX0IL31_9ACTN|nr:RNA 2',3'-cyclic phosphodiesterase [Xiamenia xianingshaonis]NHM14727.1 RNA 2',3'-cyclic phosphodiesterase [Xiamenia xianingshaonis]
MRTFIALELPEAFVDEVAGMARALGGAVEGRFAPRENYHLTLAFLGDVDDATTQQAMGALDEACARAVPVRLAADGLGKFGRASDATLWLGIAEDDGLMALAASVREGLASRRVPFDPKPFKPHVTLARRVRIPKALLPPVPFPEPVFATKATLFKSTLDRQGAIYKPLYTVEWE